MGINIQNFPTSYIDQTSGLLTVITSHEHSIHIMS